jgi:hypothetical protein
VKINVKHTDNDPWVQPTLVAPEKKFVKENFNMKSYLFSFRFLSIKE